MGCITQDMIRRRAEHNEGILYTLEELVLQEEGIEKIDVLGYLCPHLRILYMPNNLISRLENMHRLKELQYLNLAMNNIVQVEGLEHCEALEKLDLTLNFVDQQHLPSVTSLAANLHLRELFLTGNPCSDWSGYRKFVIVKLPLLKRLDAWDIKPSERISSLQEIHELQDELQQGERVEPSPSNQEQHPVCTNEKGDLLREYSPATRLAEHNELQELREQDKKKTPDKDRIHSKRRKGFDPLPTEGRVYQKNEGGWEFKLTESECGGKLILDVAVGRYLDTSLLDIDVQPCWVRLLVKGKLLQLRLPAEVKTDSSIAERSTTSGHLLVTMPLATASVHAPPQLSPISTKSKQKTKEKTEEAKHAVVDIHNIVKDVSCPNNTTSPAPLDLTSDFGDDGVPPLE